MAVGNPYTEVTITGYNVTPPTDGGEETAANTVEWAKHKDKLGDPIKTGVDSTQTAITAALDQRVMNAVSGKTGNYTVVLTDRGKSINFTGSSASTFTLPSAVTAKVGFELIVRNAGTNVLTIDGNASETIDGSTTVDLYPGQKVWLSCDGTNWLTTVAALRPGVLAKTNADSPYTVLVDDDGRVIDVDASGGAVTINLPAAATAKNGFSITIKKTDSSANAVTIDADGTETIDGELTVSLNTQNRFVELVCDATEWFLKAGGGGASSFDSALLHVVDEKSGNTDGGTFTSGAWRTRDLNTVKTNEISGASLATNQITLPAGTYWITAKAPAHNVNEHAAKLYNITDTADIIEGTSEISQVASLTTTSSFVTGRFVLAGTKTLEIQHRCNTTDATEGFGRGNNFATNMIYTDVQIWKVG